MNNDPQQKPDTDATKSDSPKQDHDDESMLESIGKAISAPIFGADEEEPGEPKDRVREHTKP